MGVAVGHVVQLPDPPLAEVQVAEEERLLDLGGHQLPAIPKT